MTELHPTRRTVVRTAAWAVPAVTLATAAPAFAASPVSCMTAANPVEWQTVQLTVYSRVRTYASVLGITNRTDGVSKVDYTLTLPRRILVGATTTTQPVAYTSTLSATDTASSYSAGGRTIQDGYVDVGYSFGGGMLTAPTVRMSLNPKPVAIPSSGQLTTRFAGTMPVLTAAATPGTYTITFTPPAQEPKENDASTWNGSQTVKTNIFGATATARVHSMVPTTIPADSPNDWGTAGQAQSVVVATYDVLPAC